MGALFDRVEALSSEALLSEVKSLTASVYRTEVKVLVHLFEIDRRRAYLPNYASLWNYSLQELGMSEGQAHLRIHVARVCRSFPLVLDCIGRGDMTLTVAGKLAKHLTEANHEQLLRECCGMTKAQVLKYLATRSPAKPVSSGIRRSRGGAKSGSNDGARATHSAIAIDVASTTTNVAVQDRDLSTVPRRANVEPASEDTYNVRFSASGDFKAKLDRLAELLSLPPTGSNVVAVLERALDEALKQMDPKQTLERRRKRSERKGAKQASPRVSSRPWYVGRRQRDEVLERAAYQCEYIGPNGRRCTERKGLQIDHIVPKARHGTASLDNLRCLCRAHNLWAAEQVFGQAFIRSKMHRARNPKPT